MIMIAKSTPESTDVLVRYGAVPEVAHFRATAALPVRRGQNVVVATHRGEELGTVLEALRPSAEPERPGEDDKVVREVVRVASEDDVERRATQQADAQREFARWEQRIAEWGLDLQLIDLEWTLDRRKLILYVLNDRGPESTKLALQAAAAGLGVVEVQPVSREGLVPAAPSSGCGSCGCHN
jgi:cell fate regulator YaaT (PSP1 superfamily)